MFCLFYIPRVRMGCWFELKREKVFLDHILANYLNSYSFTERRKSITFYLKRRSVPSRNFKRTKNVKFCFGLFAKQYFSKYWAEFKRRLVNFWMMIWSIISQRTRTVLLKGKHLKNIIFLKRRSVPQMSNFVLEEFLPFKNSWTPEKRIDEDVVFSFLFKNELFVVLEAKREHIPVSATAMF